MTSTTAGVTITKHGGIITDPGVEPTARDLIAAQSIRAARAENLRRRAERAAR